MVCVYVCLSSFIMACGDLVKIPLHTKVTRCVLYIERLK